jgi:hypothetical protein
VIELQKKQISPHQPQSAKEFFNNKFEKKATVQPTKPKKDTNMIGTCSVGDHGYHGVTQWQIRRALESSVLGVKQLLPR